MRITIYRKGIMWKTFLADEIDITTANKENDGALFLIRPNMDNGITIDAEIPMIAEFGENQITLSQPVSTGAE